MFLVTGAIVFVDTMFYAAVAPLLPVLTHQLRLSKASAGVLTASYAVGMLVGAIPAGAIAERFGPRVATYTGLALLGTSSLAFGVLDAVPCSTPPASPRASAAPARGRASSPG